MSSPKKAAEPPVALSARELDLALALARATVKLHHEWERSQRELPSREQLHWPHCWREAQHAWQTLEHYEFVRPGKKPFFRTDMFDTFGVLSRKELQARQLAADGWERVG